MASGKFLLLAGGLFFAFAGGVKAGDFERYYRIALANDPIHAAAKAQFEADLQQRPLARAGLLPSLSLSALSARNDYERRDVGAKTTRGYDYDSRSLTVRLVQPLFDMERWAVWKGGDAKARQGEIVYAEAQQEVALRFAQAWFEYLLARDSLELARAQRDSLKAQKDQVDHLYKGGFAALTDVEETAARLQLAMAAELAAKNAADLRRRELERMLGQSLDREPASVGHFAPQAPEPADPLRWTEAARKRNYKVLALQLAQEMAGYELDRSRAGFYPSVSLVMSAQQGQRPNYLTERDSNTSLGVQLEFPLFSGGRTSAQLDQSRALSEKAGHQLEDALREAEVRASQFYLELLNGAAQINAMQAAERSSDIALQGMQAGQKVGLRTNTDVLNAQQQLYTVKRDLQKARYTYLLSRLRLQAEVGSLGEVEVKNLESIFAALSR